MITTDSIATQTVADTFLSTVQERGDGPALLHPDLSVALSWREYGEQARRAAGGEKYAEQIEALYAEARS
jgi:hypothetical protein